MATSTMARSAGWASGAARASSPRPARCRPLSRAFPPRRTSPCAAIRRCGPDLTRERLVQELEGLRDFKGISGNISYYPFDPNDPGCRQGQKEVFLVQCLAGGKAKQLTDWATIE